MKLRYYSILVGLFTATTLYADALNVVRVGSIRNWSGQAMTVADNLVVVAAGANGMHVLDLSDPTRIYEAGYVTLPGEALGVVAADGYAFVAAGWAGLEIVNIANPASPREATYYDELPGVAVDVAVSGSLACVAYTGGGVAILNIDEIELPILITRIASDQSVSAVTLMDGLLIASGDQFGTRFYDMTDPTNPHQLARLNDGFIDLQVCGDKLIGCGGSMVKSFDISDPNQPNLLGSIQIDLPTDIAISEAADQILVSGRDGWSMIGMNRQGDLSLLFADNPQNSTRGVGFVNGIAAVLPSAGLESYSLDNPRNPTRLGMACNIGGILGVEKAGDYAVSVGGLMGVIDVSYPERPVVMSVTPLPGSADPLKLIGPLVYIPCEDLRVYDLSDPRNPRRLGILTTGSGMYNRDVDVEGDRAALINQDNLYVVDVSDPTNLQMLGHYPTANNVFFTSVDMVGDLIYAASNSGVLVYDASDPRYINRVGVFTGLSGGCSDVLVDGEIAYAAHGPYYGDNPGLAVVDVSDPVNPVTLGDCSLPAGPRSIAKFGDWIYVADNWAGIQIIDVTDPERPAQIGYWTENGDNYYGAAAFDRFVITADRYKGLSILQNTFEVAAENVEAVVAPAIFQLSAYPNPFNATVRIQAMLPTPGYWSLKVYNATGAEVADLGSGWKTAGAISTSFDANQTTPGSYFFRLEGGGVSVTERMVLVK